MGLGLEIGSRIEQGKSTVSKDQGHALLNSVGISSARLLTWLETGNELDTEAWLFQI